VDLAHAQLSKPSEEEPLAILRQQEQHLALQTIIHLDEIQQRGLDLLLCESTNVHQEGVTPAESELHESFDKIFHEAQGQRIFCITFSTQIERIKQLVAFARQYGRKMAFSGKGLERTVRIARDLGELQFCKDEIVPLKELRAYPKEETIIFLTGSQGEPRSAATSLIHRRHPQLSIEPGDVILWSSRWIPGNETRIIYTINQMNRQGATVFHPPKQLIHTSGHGYREDLLFLRRFMNPRYIVPIHGEYRFLIEHKKLSLEDGVPPEQFILCQNGSQLLIQEEDIKKGPPIRIGKEMRSLRNSPLVLDEKLKERRLLGQMGVLMVQLSFERTSLQDAELILRGLGTPEICQKEEASLAMYTKKILTQKLECKEPLSQDALQDFMGRRIRNYFKKEWGGSPQIMVVITPKAPPS